MASRHGERSRSRIFQIEEIPVEVTWKTVRNLNLRISRDGVLRASVPRRTVVSAVEKILSQNLPWMRRALARSKHRSMPEKPEAVEGAEVTFFGYVYTLHILEGKAAELHLSENGAVLTVPTGASQPERTACLKEGSRKLLQEAVAAHLPYVESQTGLFSSSWHIRDMKSLWGSCNVKTRRICLNLRLVQKPLKCLDAVIAHELVHTRVRNHGRDFYAMLDAVWPAWREAEAVLRKA